MLRHIASLLFAASSLWHTCVCTNKEGEKFLSANTNREGVVVLASGLQYKVLRAGHGDSHPTVDSPCECHYKGQTAQNWPDGKVFDSSYGRGQPLTMRPNQVIAGWTEAMQLMVEGDKWELYIPSQLGYGERGSPPAIGGGDALVFTMELLKIKGAKVPCEHLDHKGETTTTPEVVAPVVSTAAPPAATVVGEGMACRPTVSPEYQVNCEEGLKCVSPPRLGAPGICTNTKTEEVVQADVDKSDSLFSEEGLAAMVGAAAKITCPTGYQLHDGRCYMLSEQQGSFLECQNRVCAAHNGTLAVIHDPSVFAFFLDLTWTRQTAAFIGLFESGKDESGEWAWVDDSKTNYMHWGLGEPNNWCLDEDCAAVGFPQGKFNASIEATHTKSRLHALTAEDDVQKMCAGNANGACGDFMSWFDIACNTRLPCLCQHRGPLYASDGEPLYSSPTFLQWEEEQLALPASVVLNDTLENKYDVCFEKRKQCWWFDDQSFQIAFGCASFLSAVLVVASIACECLKVAVKLDMQREDFPSEGGLPTAYGQLLDPSERFMAQNSVNHIVNIGAFAAMGYGVALFCLALTMLLHVNFGVSFGFGIDCVEAFLMFSCKVAVGMSACVVHRFLSPESKTVVGGWVLVLACSKLLAALADLGLSVLYMHEWDGGKLRENSSFCTTSLAFSWSLSVSMLSQCLAGLALTRIHRRVASYVGSAYSFSNVIGGSWPVLLGSTLVSGIITGACASQFIFDDPDDTTDPLQSIGAGFLTAACCQLLVGLSTLRANAQVKAYFKVTGSARTITGTEMAGNSPGQVGSGGHERLMSHSASSIAATHHVSKPNAVNPEGSQLLMSGGGDGTSSFQ